MAQFKPGQMAWNANQIGDILLRIVIRDDGCWDYPNRPNREGYKVVGFQGKKHKAYRLIYEHFRGPLPDGEECHHRCRNKGCVNPDHLIPLPRRQHLQADRHPYMVLAERTHCNFGHPLEGDNLYSGRPGRRVCRQCANDASLRYYYRVRRKREMAARRAKRSKPDGSDGGA